MSETRTDTIVSREPGYRIEAWRPDRDVIDASVRLEGDSLAASVQRSRACTYAVGERRRVVTKTDRSADTTMVVVEGVSAAALMAMGAKIGDSHSDVSGIGVIPFAIGAGIGAGFVIDLLAGGQETTQHTEIVQTGVQDGPACQVGPAPFAVVSFAVAGGPVLSCTTSAEGTCKVELPPAIRQAPGKELSVDVLVDGRLHRHEELRKQAP